MVCGAISHYHYTVMAKLGGAGMGFFYRTEDMRLCRNGGRDGISSRAVPSQPSETLLP